MKLLHIDASILGDNSVSRQLSSAIVSRLRETTPDITVVYRDLSAAPLSHLSGAHLAAAQGAVPETAALREDVAAGAAALAEFLAADTVVIGAPMYNFTLPSHLKAWIDRLVIAGTTFRYGETGPEGLAKGKRVIVAIARGGLYGANSNQASSEHLETYLHTVFGFIGIAPEFIIAEGMLLGPEQRSKTIADALRETENLRAA